MEKLNEAKEKLPADYLMQFVSRGWEEVGNYQSELTALKSEFKDVGWITDIIQDLIDAYTIAIGQVQHRLSEDGVITAESSLNESTETAKPAAKPAEPVAKPVATPATMPKPAAKPVAKPAQAQPQEWPTPTSAKPQIKVTPAQKPAAKPVQKNESLNESFDWPDHGNQRQFDAPSNIPQANGSVPSAAAADFAGASDFFTDFGDPVPDAESDAEVRN